MRLIFALLGLLAWAPVEAEAAGTGADGASVEPLTSCAQVRALGRDAAEKGRLVRLRGIVTLVPGAPGEVKNFTLDDGAGVWVSPPPPSSGSELPQDLRVGQIIELEGETAAGRFSPLVVARKIRVVEEGGLPAPRTALIQDLNSGALDSQRVQLRGVVRSADWVKEAAHWELRLHVRSPHGLFSYFLIAASPGEIEGLVDSEVTLTGVCLSFFNSRRQFLGARLYSNFGEDVRIDRPGKLDPFAVPHIGLREVMTFSPSGGNLHRKQVRGVVTLARSGRFFFIEQDGAALRVNTRQTDALDPGDVVEASGFLELLHHRAEMQEAVFRKVGHETPPEPVAIRREQAFVLEPQTIYAVPQDFDDRLVSIEGSFVGLDGRQGESVRVNIMSSGALVSGDLADSSQRAALEAIRPGSLVRISGICQMTYSASKPVLEWPQPIEMRLLVRDATDVKVIAAASWWTAERLLAVLATLTLVLFASLAWIYLLRRKVSQRGQELAEAMRARRDAAVEFETVLRERSRLAADLHDTMEQSLTGMAMQLEAGKVLRATAPERSERHMELARQLLASSREDLRRSIWNLRANPLEQLTFTEALREVTANRAVGLGVEVSLHTEGDERPLPDFVAGNLLLLAQEAITNALKHAEAKLIEVRLKFEERRVTLEIRDDGKGFNPSAAAGPQLGHFGLQGMRERVKRLGGEIDIQSAPGRGTSIVASVGE